MLQNEAMQWIIGESIVGSDLDEKEGSVVEQSGGNRFILQMG